MKLWNFVHWRIAFALALSLMAATDMSHARIRSADAIGQCLDAEGGVRNGARVIAWPCYYTSPNNQHFWLDWLTDAENVEVYGNNEGKSRPLARIRIGDFCLAYTNTSADGQEMLLTNKCQKNRYSTALWTPRNVGGNRYMLGSWQGRCLTLHGGFPVAIESKADGKAQQVRYQPCVTGDNYTAADVPTHFWQFWYVEQ